MFGVGLVCFLVALVVWFVTCGFRCLFWFCLWCLFRFAGWICLVVSCVGCCVWCASGVRLVCFVVVIVVCERCGSAGVRWRLDSWWCVYSITFNNWFGFGL